MAYALDSNIVIPYLEAYQGTLRSPDPLAAQAKFDRFLSAVSILPVSLPVALHRSARKACTSGKRVRNRAFDLVIAATAIEHGLQLVTHNLADFADVPDLALYQPN